MSQMHALDGIRITDFTTMINGSYMTLLLSDMGAEVTKIEPPDGDPWRIMAGGFLAINRGKRSAVIDLKKPKGLDIIHKLIAESDVMVQNARWGVWHRLGLDYESVCKIRPDIIYVSVLGHGSTGPYSEWPAYDPLLSCRSGQMTTQGGFNQPPVFHAIPINDMACPMLGAYGAMLALLERSRTGKGQHVETSLTNSSVAMQSGNFIEYDGMEQTYPGGADIRGLSATYRFYQASDERWLFVCCANEEHWENLCKVLGKENLLIDSRFNNPGQRTINDSALVELLEAAVKEKPAREWESLLLKA